MKLHVAYSTGRRLSSGARPGALPSIELAAGPRNRQCNPSIPLQGRWPCGWPIETQSTQWRSVHLHRVLYGSGGRRRRRRDSARGSPGQRSLAISCWLEETSFIVCEGKVSAGAESRDKEDDLWVNNPEQRKRAPGRTWKEHARVSDRANRVSATGAKNSATATTVPPHARGLEGTRAIFQTSAPFGSHRKTHRPRRHQVPSIWWSGAR